MGLEFTLSAPLSGSQFAALRSLLAPDDGTRGLLRTIDKAWIGADIVMADEWVCAPGDDMGFRVNSCSTGGSKRVRRLLVRAVMKRCCYPQMAEHGEGLNLTHTA